MTTSNNPAGIQIQKDAYSIRTLDDEIRADRLCLTLLKNFHRYLHEERGIAPLIAGSLARGADYFLRDFIIDRLRGNIFLVGPAQVRGFAGNWYIHQALEPDMGELDGILAGVAAFYRFCSHNHWIDEALAADIENSCRQHDFYRERIESFHALAGDDYQLWCRACPLD